MQHLVHAVPYVVQYLIYAIPTCGTVIKIFTFCNTSVSYFNFDNIVRGTCDKLSSACVGYILRVRNMCTYIYHMLNHMCLTLIDMYRIHQEII